MTMNRKTYNFEAKYQTDEQDFIKDVKLGMKLAQEGYTDCKIVDETGLYCNE